MAAVTGCWDAVANLLRYPNLHAEDEQRMAADFLAAAAQGSLQAAGLAYSRFVDRVPAADREERFTRVFDINPACSLEIGWHLYGEDYKRGAFLVEMRQMLSAVGIEETSELPDHLIHALRALERLGEPKAQLFSTCYIQPALAKMLEGYQDADCPWHALLVGLLDALIARFGPTDVARAAPAPSPYADSIPGGERITPAGQLDGSCGMEGHHA